MKKLVSLVCVLCILLLITGCSQVEPTPIDNLEDTVIELSEPFAVSFTLEANSEMRMPFDLSITRNAIKVKSLDKLEGQYEVALFRADEEIEVAVAVIDKDNKTITFTNLVSSYDYYLVAKSQNEENTNLILQFSQHSS